MRLSKCCEAEIWAILTKIQEISSGYPVYSYKFFCSKCHKPCEAIEIDLPNREKEESNERAR